jgi:ABC-type multidrug transport system ATPase subunit
MIVTTDLVKRYGKVTAVDGVNLDVREGDRYGLLGPNGSGKTTLVRMLLALAYASSGSISIFGKAVPRHSHEVLADIGAMVEAPAAYPHLSGRANLMLFDAAGPGGSRRTRKSRVGEALERVGLGGIDRRPVKAYSLGMRQRLGLASALLRSPRLLILDEPTNGLDPRGIREIRDLMTSLNEAGTTVFLSSHLLAEVEQFCTRVGVMDRGHLVLQKQLDEVREPTGLVAVTTPSPDRVLAVLDGRVVSSDESSVLVRHDDPAELNALLVKEDIRVASIGPVRRSLEDVVLEATSGSSDRVDKS